jgi:hypothetical protein
MTPREDFVQRFGEEEARAIEAAACGHKNGVHDKPGSDPFLWALAICIGFQCHTMPRYAESHKITKGPEIDAWLRESKVLTHHDGDVDFLGLFCGAYNDYVQRKEEA